MGKRRIGILVLLAVIVPALLLLERLGLGAPATTAATSTAATATQGAREGSKGEPSIRVASDEQFVWLLRMQQLGDQEKVPGFQLLVHRANDRAEGHDRWEAVQVHGTQFEGSPTALSMRTFGQGADADCRGYVFFPNGSVREFTRTDRRPLDNLPGKPAWVTSWAGEKEGVWALWRGPLPAAKAATAPATSAPAAAGTMAATKPAVELAGGMDVWQLVNYRDGSWVSLASPGKVGAANAPAAGAQPAIIVANGQVWMVWVDPSEPQQLRVRQLPNRAGAAWSEMTISQLPSAVARPVCMILDGQVRVVWAERTANGRLHVAGAELTAGGTIDKARNLPVMELGEPSSGLDPETDVGLGREANSLMVVLAAKDGKLSSLLFDANDSKLLQGPLAIEAQTSNGHDVLITQNIVLVVMAALFCLALWPWRRRGVVMRLPPGYRTALIRQRIIGGLIDLAIPAAGVAIAYGLYNPASLEALAGTWWQGFRHPELLWETVEIRTFFAAYLGHVMISELFTGRTIGKMVMGMRVVALDGTAPSALSIVLRNLVRVPELTTLFLLMYIFVNDARQRLGDLAAQTLVVRPDEEVKEGDAGKGEGKGGT